MPTPWTVVPAEASDIESWLDIVASVEPWFGPMPDFGHTLARAVARAAAHCVRHDDAVVGGMLLSSPPAAKIDWLAVRASHRRSGVGTALVSHALTAFADAREVVVDTFGEDHPAGPPARRLYEGLGFRPDASLQNRPEGGSRQRYRRIQAA